MSPHAIITVVTGLPRSGTSLMMQMLRAGGFPIFSDGVRAPDAHNPRGYLEHAAVKGLPQDAQWLPQARGKAVKVISYLLPHIPPDEAIDVILMRRSLMAVMASQATMLGTASYTASNLTRDEDRLRRLYQQELEETVRHLRGRRHARVLEVAYAATLRDPPRVVETLADWLRAPLDRATAARAVEPALSRHGFHDSACVSLTHQLTL